MKLGAIIHALASTTPIVSCSKVIEADCTLLIHWSSLSLSPCTCVDVRILDWTQETSTTPSTWSLLKVGSRQGSGHVKRSFLSSFFIVIYYFNG
jgi:hypothetical protein